MDRSKVIGNLMEKDIFAVKKLIEYLIALDQKELFEESI
jgi:hypothetical protein